MSLPPPPRRLQWLLVVATLAITIQLQTIESGLIKDVFQKITGTNNKTEDLVKQSAPICGSGAFSTPNEASLSPEIIFITSRPSRLRPVANNGGHSQHYNSKRATGDQEELWPSGGERRRPRPGDQINEVANEFRFHVENVTLEELEGHGFNREAPVSFLMHGFTSGYPLQAWISAIVEAYTIDRESSSSSSSSWDGHQTGNSLGRNPNTRGEANHGQQGYGGSSSSSPSHHQSQNQNQNQRRNRDTTDYGRDYNSREPKRVNSNNHGNNYGNNNNNDNNHDYNDQSGGHQQHHQQHHQQRQQSKSRVDHNLFIVNWNYAARGILYPRAVANIPIVASYVTKFINEKLLGEARVEPRRIQLIGHSLGAHLAGFIGKNTRQRVGRIYGLDPAGPCFGTLVAGPLYPASKRLAPDDADEVISIHTNSALLGHDRPLGSYSVFVEGGATQPGCKGGGALKSLATLTWDGGDFDTIACSHSRAPNLLTYRHDQGDQDDDCQLVAYGCKDWQSYLAGQCGVCNQAASGGQHQDHGRTKRWARQERNGGPLSPVECLRIGLDWQYPKSSGGAQRRPSGGSGRPPAYEDQNQGQWQGETTSRRPNYPNDYSSSNNNHFNSSNYGRENNNYNTGYSTSRRPPPPSYSPSTRRPYAQPDSSGNNYNYNNERLRRDARNQSSSSLAGNESDQPAAVGERRGGSGQVEPISLFLRTGDTQPYCAFQYQIVLELNEPFSGARGKPPMSIILQDSEPEPSNAAAGGQNLDQNSHRDHESRRQTSTSSPTRRGEQNSLSNDEFGVKFDERTYTHLLTSSRKLKRIDHATLIFRNGLTDGHQVFRALHVNYMSHSSPAVRRNLSSRLCPVRTETDRAALGTGTGSNRFYFKPCELSDRN